MSAARPWLSILIPVYNVEPYLRQCVESVMAQTDETAEVLLYDDASTDGSPALMAQLAAQYAPRLQLLRAERNGGLSAARNALLEASRGEWIWFLDSDDYLYPGAIASLRKATREPGADLVMCDFRDVHERRGLKYRLRELKPRSTHRLTPHRVCVDTSALISGSFLQGHLHSWSKIARRELWGQDLRFPVGRYFEDIATTPTLMVRSRGAVYVPEVWVAYRKRAGSILSTGNAIKTDHMHAALTGLPALLDSASRPVSDAARRDASYFVAKMFVSAMRHAHQLKDTARLALYYAEFCRNAPVPANAIAADWRRRGWWWRAIRLTHWIRVGRRAQAELASAQPSAGTS